MRYKKFLRNGRRYSAFFHERKKNGAYVSDRIKFCDKAVLAEKDKKAVTEKKKPVSVLFVTNRQKKTEKNSFPSKKKSFLREIYASHATRQ